MKTIQFLGVAGALLSTGCEQAQQVTLLGRDEIVRAPSGQYSQVVLFGNGQQADWASYVSVQQYKSKQEADKAAQKHPVGTKQRIVGWREDLYPLEYIGSQLYVNQNTK